MAGSEKRQAERAGPAAVDLAAVDLAVTDPAAVDPIAHYRTLLARRSAEEKRIVARVKRAMERFLADKPLRDALQEQPGQANALFAARGYDLGIDLAALAPIWRREAGGQDGGAPELRAWSDWIRDLRAHRDLLRAHGEAGANPRFDAWRRREIARCDSALPEGTSKSIVHPIVAFELSSGCSVGCWFCGVSAERFRGAQPYTPEAARQWRGMLEALAARFGQAAQTGFCYWATDPCDNPDYDRFVADYREITGYLPQTTTAAPLKDVALTRRVLALAEQTPCVVNRFSVLTLRKLEEIHAAFTPDELLTVELVIQTRESLIGKSQAGRMRERKLRQRERNDSKPITEAELDGGTIACVTGFLVNLPEGRLQLISPCPPDARWPLGYRVYAEGGFTDAAGFAALLDEAVERCMPGFPDAGTPIAWRADLALEPRDDRTLVLANRFHRTTVRGAPFLGRLAARLAEPTPAGELLAEAMAASGDLFTASQALQDFYDSGLVEAPVETVRLRAAGVPEPAAAEVA